MTHQRLKVNTNSQYHFWHYCHEPQCFMAEAVVCGL